MDQFTQQEPFNIIKNYRKLQARRRRYHKKRKPKCYPPTNIQTRSMEYKKPNEIQFTFFDWQKYSQMAPNSQQFYSSKSPQLLMFPQDQEKIERSMEIQVLSLGDEQKPLQQNSRFFFWNNEQIVDINDQQLLEIH